MIAGIRVDRERVVNARVIPTAAAVESCDLAREVFNWVVRKVPEKVG